MAAKHHLAVYFFCSTHRRFVGANVFRLLHRRYLDLLVTSRSTAITYVSDSWIKQVELVFNSATAPEAGIVQARDFEYIPVPQT
ncbi:hypothetical protein LINPERPRIM_LOCUS26668 [Linum perenne]